MNRKIASAWLLFLGLSLTNCTDKKELLPEEPRTLAVKEATYQSLQKTFSLFDYQLDRLEDGVPPLLTENVPGNLGTIVNVDNRKRLFFKIMLPLILLANEEILIEREQLFAIEAQYHSDGTLDPEYIQHFENIASRYRFSLEQTDLPTAFDILRRRVDVIPVDLALAQAANESAWGTSRFARTANNLFGEWTFIPGTGVVPRDRPEGEIYEVKRFPTLFDSVRSYANNLNSHFAYRDFRAIRARLREDGAPVSGLILAQGLSSYSIRGEEYIEEIQSMIRHNNLDRLAQANLR